MGQTCSQSCNYPRPRAGPGCSAPKLPAVPLRGHAPFGGAQRGEEEEQVHFHTHALRVSVAAQAEAAAPRSPAVAAPTGAAVGSAAPAVPRRGWRSAYAIGPLLGDGISAKVYEAEALSPGLEGKEGAPGFDPGVLWGSCSNMTMPQCLRERGRRVAIKRFHRAGSRTYQKELSALRRVGVYPHVLRLLESYEGYDGEDVLVLEYCDGSTLYDLYAREHPHGGLPERLIARLVRQLLLALEHLSACGVEHQDVKPENMMLYDVSVQSGQGELKLGDFGWAAVAPPPGAGGARASRLPATGAGSLWYAPPELNPPVKGVPTEWELPADAQGNAVQGRSDMWSVGVVLYLLLIGHNPFNTALKQSSPEGIDNEVLRLAALGQFNRRTEKWLHLHMDARDFISVLLRVRPCARPSATEALQHPFLTRRLAKSCEASVFFHGAVAAWADREAAWRRLDGFQRLGWLAVARAVAEPELDRSVVASALDGMQSAGAPPGSRDATYLWQLARELATTPVFQWLQDRGAWTDILRLAFAYLDLDEDGLLTPPDLAAHVVRPPPGSAGLGARNHDDDVCLESAMATANTAVWARACRWVLRWQDPEAVQPLSSSGHPGLRLASLREALLRSRGPDDLILSGMEGPPSSRVLGPAGGGAGDFAAGGGAERRGGGGQRDLADGYARPAGHDEEEITWTDMVPQSPAV